MNSQNNIMLLLLSRSEHAIEELSKTYDNLCRTIANRILADPQDIEEIINDVYLKVWNSIPPEHPSSLPAYIGTITHNVAISRLRSNTACIRDQRLSTCLSELQTCLPDPVTPDQLLERKFITDTINAFLTTLPKTNRLIFMRRYYCMDTTKEIAKLTGMTDQAVRSRLLRMREQLRNCFEKEGIHV